MKRKSFVALIMSIMIVFSTSIQVMASEQNEYPPLDILAQSAIVMDMDTKEVIASKNAKQQMPMASTVKLLTSLIFSENASKSDVIEFTEDSLKTQITALNNLKTIEVGDRISSNDLMKAVLVHSANDAAYLMADFVAGDYLNFVKAMNNKVSELGLEDTQIFNPCGLESNAINTDDTSINTSTAYDMAIIASEAYKDEWVKEVVTTKYANPTVMIQGENVPITMRNKIIGQFNNLGGKTGNESKAGHCFVGYFEKDGRNLVTVALNSPYGMDGTNVFKDTRYIADYGYEAKKEVYKKKGEEIAKINLEYKKYVFFGPKEIIEVPVVASKDITYYKNEINDKNIKIEYTKDEKRASALAGQNVKLDFSVNNITTQVDGVVKFSKQELNKIFGTSLMKMIIVSIPFLIFIVAYSIRLKNLRKKRKRRKANQKKRKQSRR